MSGTRYHILVIDKKRRAKSRRVELVLSLEKGHKRLTCERRHVYRVSKMFGFLNSNRKSIALPIAEAVAML